MANKLTSARYLNGCKPAHGQRKPTEMPGENKLSPGISVGFRVRFAHPRAASPPARERRLAFHQRLRKMSPWQGPGQRPGKPPGMHRRARRPFDFFPHPPALPAGGANEICFRYQFAAVKRGLSVAHVPPEAPFYSKLMDRMKGQPAGLSFAACRKSFFDKLFQYPITVMMPPQLSMDTT